MDLNEVNNLSFQDFVKVFGNVVERCPFVAGAVWPQRPFHSLNDLCAAIDDFIDSLPESGKEGMLRCMSELACGDQQQGPLSQESQKEQAQAGLIKLQTSEALLITQLNTKYRMKFGFPFVACARIYTKEKILQQQSERCSNEYVVEFMRAIEEIKKIYRLLVKDLVLDNSGQNL